MKLLALIFMLSIALFSSLESKSQAVVARDGGMVFTDGDGNTFNSVKSKTIISASGFMVKTATFQLPEDHDYVPEKGTYVIGMRFVFEYLTDENDEYVLDEDGDKIPIDFITDEKVDINHKGKFNVVMHLNGAGNTLPLGWYVPGSYE